MTKYVIEGWVRARLIYLTNDNIGIDQFTYFSSKCTDLVTLQSVRKRESNSSISKMKTQKQLSEQPLLIAN
ncbi:MAG: hypothetical protein QM398_06995 [Thermoproteota archaeon]|nr:hypothetical protein [Thermoproteota archaeon]NLD66293.1 hypothetical protein [Thermoproteota archaeon]